MSCKHPLKAFKIGVNPETGKDILKITSYKVDHLERKSPDSAFELIYDDYHSSSRISYDNWIEIPCGQCISCRLDYSREWANRCLLEMQYHKKTYFVTLTYDDEHLPTDILDVDPETGETDIPIHSLNKKDLQDFFKNLRYYYNDNKIRYYACGEYGDKGRPHFHAIIFGLDLKDLQYYKRVVQNGEVYFYYTSELLNKAWKHKGYIIVAPATWESIAYTARYVMKKLKGDAAQFYKDYNLEPEFVVMSRKPGIAKQYFDDNLDMFNKDLIRVGTIKGIKEFGIPRYFKKHFDMLDEEAYNIYKDSNIKQAEINKSIKLQKTSQSYLEMLQTEEDSLNEKLKRLQRNKL